MEVVRGQDLFSLQNFVTPYRSLSDPECEDGAAVCASLQGMYELELAFTHTAPLRCLSYLEPDGQAN
jgi:hypothetical protein